jgi:hypothetical protein
MSNPTLSAGPTPTRPAPQRHKPARPVGGTALGRDRSRPARQLAAAILEVLAGLRTPTQAAQALGLSLPRYYQVESRALQGLLEACEPRPKGRQPQVEQEVVTLQRDNQRLQRELARQQTLTRLTQRSLGLAPPAPPPPAKGGSKKRRRRPTARALHVAARLQTDNAPLPQLAKSLQQLSSS